jgi:hypothetical protein
MSDVRSKVELRKYVTNLRMSYVIKLMLELLLGIWMGSSQQVKMELRLTSNTTWRSLRC